MKILILSYFFPPHAGMGALRAGRLAEFLSRAGHEVQVVAARGRNEAVTGAPEPSAGVSYTRWLDVNFAPDRASRFKNRVLGRADSSARSGDGGMSQGSPNDRSGFGPGALLSRLDRLYRHCLNVPDDKVGWLPFALAVGWRRARTFKPDVIYASGPPYTGLVAAAWLARRLGVPWIAEMRDRWADDPYDARPPWRAALDLGMERRVLGSAQGIVTVSETWARAYRERYGKPVLAVANGFSPEDYSQPLAAPAENRDSLRIVYTGAVYAGRDPAPLWQALALLGPAAEGVRVEFYGAAEPEVMAGAARHGVAARVSVRAPVPYRSAVALQRGADVLLMLQWNDPCEQGNLPGKLFEYLGARRPILAFGHDGGEMAAIVQERGAGLFSNDPKEIARQIEAWHEEKRSSGEVAPLPETARAGFTRDEQFGELEGFLGEVFSD